MEIYIIAGALLLAFLIVVVWGILSLIDRKGGPTRYEMYEDHAHQVTHGEYGWAES